MQELAQTRVKPDVVAPAKKHRIVFGAPQIEQAEIDEVVDCLRSGWLGTGPKVARFERDFAAYKGLDAARVAATSSCTADPEASPKWN